MNNSFPGLIKPIKYSVKITDDIEFIIIYKKRQIIKEIFSQFYSLIIEKIDFYIFLIRYHLSNQQNTQKSDKHERIFLWMD